MKLITFKAVFLFMLFAVQTKSQNILKPNIRINVGDSVPNYTMMNILNYSKQQLNLNDFKGKILILDFWTFDCTACVSSWPKLLALQREFKDDIQILLVNERGDKKQIQEFIRKQEKINNYIMDLPIIYNESRLGEHFPHSLVPHIVFINRKGIVKYIPHPIYLNRETIKSMVLNKALQLRKVSDNPVMPQSKPIFVNGYLTEDPKDTRILWCSIITPYMSNAIAVADFGRTSVLDGRTYGWIANHSLEKMLRLLHSYKPDPRIPIPVSRRLFKDLDTTSYVSSINGIAQLENLFTVQLSSERDVPVNLIRKKMLSDIQECFGIESYWMKQRKKCIVISRGKHNVPLYKSGERELAITNTFIKFNNVTISDIIQKLEDGLLFYTNYPILDETGLETKLGKIYLESVEKINFHFLQKALIKYGLTLSIEDREIDMLVITKIKD